MMILRVNSFILFIILVCASAAISSDGRQRSKDVLFSQLVDAKSGLMDKELAELLRSNCRLDSVHMKEVIKDLDLRFLDETFGSTNEINCKRRSTTKENIQKIDNVVNPQLKQMILDCLCKNNPLLHVSGEDVHVENWYTKYLGSLFHTSNVGGRNRRELLQSADTPALAPSPVGSPTVSPAPSPAPSSSKVPDSQLPAPSPQVPFFKPDVTGSNPQSPTPASPDSSSNVQGDNKSNRNKIVTAVIITASVTFVVAALLFLCWTRVCGRGYGARKNDDRPLLSLSMADYSSGSALNSFALGNSTKEEKVGHQAFSFNNNTSNIKIVSSLDNNKFTKYDSPGAIGGSSNTEARIPPPGKMGTAPLKPPPGRLDPLPDQVDSLASHVPPLPPKPPAYHKHPPSKPGPPPPAPAPSVKTFGNAAPPPPAPPPSVKSSGNAAPPPGPLPPPPPTQRSSGNAAPPPPPLPSGSKPGPHPPPPPKRGAPPPRPPPSMAMGSKVTPPSPLGSEGLEAGAPKPKLKPFFWDKVLANPDTSMVWHQIKAGSFQFNEEMIENLFGSAPVDKNKNEKRKESSSQDPKIQYIQIIDSKKSQNLAILLRALNLSIEEVCDSVHEGNELPSELVQTLLKMAPTQEEELKLRVFTGELTQLGPADRFLKTLVDIPFAFKRLEAILFMSTLQEDVTIIKESFATLEVACKELRNSRLFLKLLEAVLKTGNRMNDGTFRGGAQAFKLDTLLKLSDVKGIDGKTTLLHFVVQEIIRSEGVRAARVARESKGVKAEDFVVGVPNNDSEEHYRNLGLQVVSGVGSELENVKKAANLDGDNLTGTVAKLSQALVKTRAFLNSEMKNVEEKRGFYETLQSFIQHAEIDIAWLLEEEKRIMTLVKSTGDYFHGHSAKDEGLRLFVIVRDFLIILEKVCKQVQESPKRPTVTQKKEAPAPAPAPAPSPSPAQAPPSTSDARQPPLIDLRDRLFPAITDQRMYNSSSDDES